ncbi:Hypothetical predicted protein, partial [Paramuricea clavata]
MNSDLNLYVSCYVVPVICSPLTHQPVQFASSHYSHLRNLYLADSGSNGQEPSDIDMLIRADFFWHIVSGKVIRGEHGPIAMETKLGYVLSGPVTTPHTSDDIVANFLTTHLLRVDTTEPEDSLNVDLHSQLKKFWELEAIGVNPNKNPVYEQFKETIEFKDGRYEVCLPWRESHHPVLPDNFELSERCLASQVKRGGAGTIPTAYELYLKSRQRMSEGGFSLRKWATNDPTLREEIASHEVDNFVTERTSEKPIAEDNQTYAASSLGTNVTDSCENIRK